MRAVEHNRFKRVDRVILQPGITPSDTELSLRTKLKSGRLAKLRLNVDAC